MFSVDERNADGLVIVTDSAFRLLALWRIKASQSDSFSD
jgi:hypothetical protein